MCAYQFINLIESRYLWALLNFIQKKLFINFLNISFQRMKLDKMFPTAQLVEALKQDTSLKISVVIYKISQKRLTNLCTSIPRIAYWMMVSSQF